MSPHGPGREGESGPSAGFILIAVLWILSATAALVAVYALYVRQTAMTFPIHGHRLQAEALAEAGVEMAAYQLTAGRSQPSKGTLRFRLGGADVAVSFRAENGRIDLNEAPEAILAGLFAALGASRERAADFARRIVAWRTPNNAKGKDSEAGGNADPAAGPHRGPFQNVSELEAVPGLSSPFLQRALPNLTVFNGQAGVNVLAAPPDVLAALPGMSPGRLQDFLDRRGTAPLDVLMARLGATASFVTVQPGDANHVNVSITFNADKSRFDYDIVILLLHGNAEPYRVLSWHNLNELSNQPS